MQTQRKSLKFISGRILLYLVLIVTSILMIIPFYWSVGTSLKLEHFVFASPPQWWPSPLTFQSYINVLTHIPFLRYFSTACLLPLSPRWDMYFLTRWLLTRLPN